MAVTWEPNANTWGAFALNFYHVPNGFDDKTTTVATSRILAKHETA